MLPRVAHHNIHIVIGRPAANDVAREGLIVRVARAAARLVGGGVKAGRVGKEILVIEYERSLQVVEILLGSHACRSHLTLILHVAVKKIHVLGGGFKLFFGFCRTQVHCTRKVVVADQ